MHRLLNCCPHLQAYTLSSLSLYYISYGYEVRDLGDGSVLLHFSSRIDVFVMKVCIL